jgi:hypothetical protein
MVSRSMVAAVSVLFAVSALAVSGCADDSVDGDDEVGEPDTDAREVSEENLTRSEKVARCNEVKRSRAFSPAESQRLLSLIMAKAGAIKRENDREISRRGIGQYMGNRSYIYLMLNEQFKDEKLKIQYTPAERASRRAEALRLVQERLKPGFDAATVMADVRGTSCIGFVYQVLRSAYAELGRAAECAAVVRGTAMACTSSKR